MFACAKPQMTMAGSKKASRKTDRGYTGMKQELDSLSVAYDVVLHF